MKKNRVIKRENLPLKISIWNPLTCFLALERFNAPGWLYGALGVLFLFADIAAIYRILTETEVDLLNPTGREAGTK
jgi:hypothetical protein